MFICFNISAGVCFLIVHKWLHTATKLALQWCFCNFSHPPAAVLFFNLTVLFSRRSPPFINLAAVLLPLPPYFCFCGSHLNLSSLPARRRVHLFFERLRISLLIVELDPGVRVCFCYGLSASEQGKANLPQFM